MINFKKYYYVAKWVLTNHFWLAAWTYLSLIATMHGVIYESSVGWFWPCMLSLFGLLWTPIFQENRIIPLHKDWKDFGKVKKTSYVEDEWEETEDDEEVDDDELTEIDEEYNESVVEWIDECRDLIAWNDARAISYTQEIKEDGTISFTVVYKPI
jgi:hypothetical protein